MNSIRKIIATAAAVAAMSSLVACSNDTSSSTASPSPTTSQSQTVKGEISKGLDRLKDKAKTEKDKLKAKADEDKQGDASQGAVAAGDDAKALMSWDESIAPNYYETTGKANLPANVVAPGTIEYQGLDSLGRTGWSHGNINWDMVEKSAGWRAPFDPDVKGLSGWYNPVTGKSNNRESRIVMDNGRVYKGYFYNRSHLIADSLGGASSRKNLVTGTRMQNVGDNSGNPGGMAYMETKIRNLLYSNHNVTVAYYVQPIYNGNEIVPRGTVVDAKSSDGSIDEHIIVWNYAKGHTIDYTTGAWQ